MHSEEEEEEQTQTNDPWPNMQNTSMILFLFSKKPLSSWPKIEAESTNESFNWLSIDQKLRLKNYILISQQIKEKQSSNDTGSLLTYTKP